MSLRSRRRGFRQLYRQLVLVPILFLPLLVVILVMMFERSIDGKSTLKVCPKLHRVRRVLLLMPSLPFYVNPGDFTKIL